MANANGVCSFGLGQDIYSTFRCSYLLRLLASLLAVPDGEALFRTGD